MTVFGANFKAYSADQLEKMATPPSGSSEQAIWDQRFDSLTYTSAVDTLRKFFANINADTTLSNMEAQGMFPKPQVLQIHNICCDVLAIIPVSITTAAGAPTAPGALSDIALLLMGSAQRPTWTLRIQNKDYGPYSVTLLGGTGGPTGWGWGSSIATNSGSWQYGRNDPSNGWNYFGRIIIPSMANFSLSLNWATAATMTENKIIRISLLGVLNRAIT